MSNPFDNPEAKEHKAEFVRRSWLRAWVRDFLLERYQREGEAAFTRFKEEEASVSFHANSGVDADDKATIEKLIDEVIAEARAYIAAGKGPWRKKL